VSFFEVKNLTAGYGKKKVLKGCSFTLESGCLLGILGANGSGKTTLLKSVCGIIPYVGECILEGISLKKLSPKKLSSMCGYIPQRSGISIDISVLDTVLMGYNSKLGLLDYPTSEMKLRAAEKIKRVGLCESLGTDDINIVCEMNYQKLSEGQKQLCILARTLVTESRLLLLDEPESALDFRYRRQMIELIRTWTDENEASAMIALHDPMLALNYCDKIMILSEGNIIGTVSPKEEPYDAAEILLSKIYGNVSISKITGRSGEEQLVMLSERDL